MISIVLKDKDRDEMLMLDLAAYIAEHIPVIPVLKHDRIVLDELAHVDVQDVSSRTRSFLEMRGINHGMSVDHARRMVTLYIEGGTGTGRYKRVHGGLLTCPHCNYTTEYEDILNIHTRVHYI